jgi:hypothetical protein
MRTISRLLAAVTAVWALWLAGCAKKPAQESAPETPDTLAVISDTPPVIPDTFTDSMDMNAYRTTANDKNVKDYPDEIKCVTDSVIPGFSHWEELTAPAPNSPMACWLNKAMSPDRVISSRHFVLSGKSDDRACILVEIWKMKSLDDAKKLYTFLENDYSLFEADLHSMCVIKLPTSYFVFKEYIFWINGCSFSVDERIYGVNKHIRTRCFNCGDIEGDFTNNSKYGCRSDKVIFGQNDKDW